MKKLQVSSSIDSGLLQVQIDGKAILREPGSAEIDLKPGRNYKLQWFAIGERGRAYTVRVTNPAEAKLNVTSTIKNDGKDSGSIRFTVK